MSAAIPTAPQCYRLPTAGTAPVYLVLDPLRVAAFNIADGWMRDVTADIARQWQRCRTAASSATTQAARRLKGTARSHPDPGDEPSLVRRGMSVA